MSEFGRLTPDMEAERLKRLEHESKKYATQFEILGYPEHKVSAFLGPKDNIAMVVGVPHINNSPYGWPIPLLADAVDQFREYREKVSKAPAENVVFIREGRQKASVMEQAHDLQEAILYFGHPGFAHYVGTTEFGARVISGEPDCYEQELVQKEGFTPELVAFYCCLRNIPQTYRRQLDDDALKAYLEECFWREARNLTSVPDSQFTMEQFEFHHIMELYEAFYGHKLLPLSEHADFKLELAMSETVGPMFDDLPSIITSDMQVPRQHNSDESIVREICVKGNLLRDRNYFQLNARELEAGNDTLVIVGTPHAREIEKMFLKSNSEPLPLEENIYPFQYSARYSEITKMIQTHPHAAQTGKSTRFNSQVLQYDFVPPIYPIRPVKLIYDLELVQEAFFYGSSTH